ncbi:TetR/AcrR family transcriptional regulator C-terminal ligand-binding domain-containing protein [Actinoplanes sp. Pm04-4]|uniref:TetR/AcrR family transcriptional regulator C-terminal ligand-binding domain-containing protein n=1 Tax=Paractinoplanes pyxinae TaxID=2997416 RepID=A0ABT4AY96_9ACTN|nr:TetR/AcrR family transcriptional regulator [Actinoplanes pyxinae]MCY1139190.1 TetR/AcrR family transcriptional regulator C-terminal ligand-binding domain-containing protein [Actinoplanes pyxinae]
MSDLGNGLRRGRGRRPAEAVRAAALTATGEMLFESGLPGLTFDKVAQRAGVSKMTLYKWWPSPGALAFEAYFAAVEPRLAFEDTGDIEHDLRNQLRSFVRLLTADRGGPVIAALVGAAQSDPGLATVLASQYTVPRRTLAVERLRRAQQDGQIAPDVDLQVVVDQLWGACYHRLLMPAEPLTLDFVDALLRNLLRGITQT